MTRARKLAAAGGGCVALLLALTAAQRPAALTKTAGGEWEIVGQPGRGAQKLCLADLAVLAQHEHRGTSCTRVVIRDLPSVTEIHYTCAGGGFGRTKMTVITPRSLRVETQGISNNFPFNYTLQVRRLGDCPATPGK
jgi:hypothetical protein